MPRLPAKPKATPVPAARSRRRSKPAFEPPVFTFRVRLLNGPDTGGETSAQVIRQIELAGNQPLALLGHTIPRAFGFDEHHLWAFFLSGKAWDVGTEWGIDDDCAGYADEVMLRDVPFPGASGKKEFLYIFDFGDDWRFGVKLLRTRPALEEGAEYPRVVASVGIAPPQYPNWDDDEGWDEDGDEDE